MTTEPLLLKTNAASAFVVNRAAAGPTVNRRSMLDAWPVDRKRAAVEHDVGGRAAGGADIAGCAAIGQYAGGSTHRRLPS